MLAKLLSTLTVDRIDAEYLLAFCLQKPKSFLYTHPEYEMTPSEVEHFHTLIQKRQAGWPIAYLIAQRDFYALTFKVTQDTLIPRPETELLVERVLHHIQSIHKPKILELGTGCGAIALSIAHERPDAIITASDINPATLAVAKENAALLKLNQVQFVESHWFHAIRGKYHVIVSNPPYVAADSPYLKNLRFEPQEALVSGETGVDALTHIIQEAPAFLLPQGVLCLEHGYDQAIAVQNLFKKVHYQGIQTFQDLSEHPRVTEACFYDNKKRE